MALLFILSTLFLLSPTILCSGEKKAKTKEVYEFKAETAKLMDIIINSLYSTRDVFMRELISNSADALEKARLASLKDDTLLGSTPEERELSVKIWVNPEEREIIIQDSGIGMSKQELVDNLGTIAESGTKKFFDEMAEAQKNGGNSAEAAANLIGQFGVGFFSAFLVADFVTVDSVRMVSDPRKLYNAYRWTSDSKSGFTISPLPDSVREEIGRGTRITLHIRPNDKIDNKSGDIQYYYDFDALLTTETLKNLIDQYSGYIQFPIYSKDEVETEQEEEVCREEEEVESESESESEDAGETESGKKMKLVTKCKMEKKKVKEMKFVKANSSQVIWMKDPSEISDAEYISFYKDYLAKGKMSADPAGWIHYRSTIYADSIAGKKNAKSAKDVQFTVLVFLPRDNTLRFRPDKEKLNNGFKLHVNRIYVTDDLKSVIPAYLDFCFGVIDITDVGSGSASTINLSREMLQNNKVLELVGKNVTKKIIEKMVEMHKADIQAFTGKSEEKKEGEEEGEKKEKKQHHVDGEREYKFFEMYGKYADNIKMGVIDEKKNAKKIDSLVRFLSNKSFEIYPDTAEWLDKVSYSHNYDKVVRRMRTLDDYVDSKLENQEFIYYLGCRDVDECERSPLAEYALGHGFEVFYLYEPYDTFAMKHVGEYRGLKVADLMGPRVKFPGAVKTDEETQQEIDNVDNESLYKSTIKRIKSVLAGRMFAVTLSSRLTDSPALVVSRAGMPTATEIRVLESQFLSESRTLDKREENRVIEINPQHRLIQNLRKAVEKDLESGVESPAVNEAIVLLYEASSVQCGYVTESAAINIVPKIHQAMGNIDLTLGWSEAREEAKRNAEEHEHEKVEEKEKEKEDKDEPEAPREAEEPIIEVVEEPEYESGNREESQVIDL